MVCKIVGIKEVVPEGANGKGPNPRQQHNQQGCGQGLLACTYILGVGTRRQLHADNVAAGPTFVGQGLKRQAQVSRVEDNEGEVQEDKAHLCVVRAQPEGLRSVFVVGDVDGVDNGYHVDNHGEIGRRVVDTGLSVGSVKYGTGKGKGQDGKGEHDHPDAQGHHGVIHQGPMEAGAFPATEQPESRQLFLLFLVHGLPRLLEIGHVGFHPLIVDDLAARGGRADSVEVGRLGELLPLEGTLAEGRTEGHCLAFARVVELAARDVAFGRGHVVVRGRPGGDWSAGEQQRGRIARDMVVFVGSLHPWRERPHLSRRGAGVRRVASGGGQRVGIRRDGVTVRLPHGSTLGLVVAGAVVARGGGRQAGLRALRAGGGGGRRRNGRRQQAGGVGLILRHRAQEGSGAIALLDHGLARHAG